MTIKELCEIANTQLVIRYPSVEGRYHACIADAEIKENPDDPILQACFGYGDTADSAIYEMIHSMRGKTLIMRAGYHLTFKVPETLTKGNL